MPFTGDTRGLRNLQRNIASLARPGAPANNDLVRGMIGEVRQILRDEFSASTNPFGSPWQKTVRKQLALVSRKLPQDIRGTVAPGQAVFKGRIPWLSAHQTGHTFAARKVEAEKQYLTFNKRGRLIKRRAMYNRKGAAVLKKGVYQIFAKAHGIGARVLPQRLIYPDGAMPARWSTAIARGVTAGMERWHEQATK